MRKSLWSYFVTLSKFALLVLLSSLPAFSQTAYVTSVTVSPSTTTYLGAPVQLTVQVYRDSTLSGFNIDVFARAENPYIPNPTGSCLGSGIIGALTISPGATSGVITLNCGPEVTSHQVNVSVYVYDAEVSGGGVVYYMNDPGVPASFTILPVTLSATVTPSVVSPGGSNPELSVSMKNANGTVITNQTPTPTSSCDLFSPPSWDYSNPNVTVQDQLPLIQPPTTETCQILLSYKLEDGTLSTTTSVTYQESPNSADLGPSCPRAGGENMCGSPINLTNGNVWTQRTDYSVPGVGGGIALTRVWNSQWPSYSPWAEAGMFGDSWQSSFEKHMQLLSGGKQVLYWRCNGSSWFFTLSKGTGTLSSPPDERATLVYSSKTGYTLTLRDGSVEIYSTNGFLTALQDRNGNQTSITYDGSSYNRISKVTSADGQVLQFNYGNSLLPAQVTSIQDSVGTIATYTYDSSSHLLSVTYADGSVINNSYDGNGLLLSVTDQQNKLLESHTYDNLRRGLSSQRAYGVDALTVTYADVGSTAAATLLNDDASLVVETPEKK